MRAHRLSTATVMRYRALLLSCRTLALAARPSTVRPIMRRVAAATAAALAFCVFIAGCGSGGSHATNYGEQTARAVQIAMTKTSVGLPKPVLTELKKAINNAHATAGSSRASWYATAGTTVGESWAGIFGANARLLTPSYMEESAKAMLGGLPAQSRAAAATKVEALVKQLQNQCCSANALSVPVGTLAAFSSAITHAFPALTNQMPPQTPAREEVGFYDMTTLESSLKATEQKRLSNPSGAYYDPGVTVASVTCITTGSQTAECLSKLSDGVPSSDTVDISADGQSYISQ
jgi:hypothetical protein